MDEARWVESLRAVSACLEKRKRKRGATAETHCKHVRIVRRIVKFCRVVMSSRVPSRPLDFPTTKVTNLPAVVRIFREPRGEVADHREGRPRANSEAPAPKPGSQAVAISYGEKQAWVGERVVLLVEFTGAMDEEWDAMRCDSSLVGLDNKPENWDPLFGWEGSLPPAKGASKALPAQCALPARTLDRTPPAELDPPPATPLERQRKRKFETLYRGVHRCTLYGSEMGAVKDMIVAMCDEGVPAAKRTRNTVGEKITGWSQRWSWPAHSWTKTPKFSSKGGGGKWGLAATKNALNDSHRHLSV